MKFIAFIKYITFLFVFLLSSAYSYALEGKEANEDSLNKSPAINVSVEDVTSENSVFEKEFIPYRDYDGSIGEYFLGEELIFSIKALFIDDVAGSTLTLSKLPDGRYNAVLKASANGFVGWLLSGREDVYSAILEEVDNGKKFKTVSFHKGVKFKNSASKKSYRKQFDFDYERGIIKSKKWTRGKLKREIEYEFENASDYDGPLTAFFNFRFGTYGPMKEGESYIVRSIPKKKKTEEIKINVISNSKDVIEKFAYHYFVKLVLEKDFFDSKNGDIDMYFDDNKNPLFVIAREIDMIGDVSGQLVKRIVHKEGNVTSREEAMLVNQ